MMIQISSPMTSTGRHFGWLIIAGTQDRVLKDFIWSWAIEPDSITKCLAQLSLWEEMGVVHPAVPRKLMTIPQKTTTAKKSQEFMS